MHTQDSTPAPGGKGEPRRRRAARLGMSAVFLSAGIGHFVIPRPFELIIPDELPAKRTLVYVTGVAEIAGGVALLMPRVPPLVGKLLAAFLVLVFPANLNQAIRNIQFDPDRPVDRRLLWARLPLQLLLIGLVLRATRPWEPTE